MTEERRSFDAFSLAETEHISAAEIAAAQEISFNRWNTQGQREYSWGPSLNVIGAYRDQLARTDDISTNGDGPGMLLLHDDAERESAYTAGAEDALERAGDRDWTVISMKNDWVTVFADR
jgi:hypothetical protein